MNISVFQVLVDVVCYLHLVQLHIGELMTEHPYRRSHRVYITVALILWPFLFANNLLGLILLRIDTVVAYPCLPAVWLWIVVSVNGVWSAVWLHWTLNHGTWPWLNPCHWVLNPNHRVWNPCHYTGNFLLYSSCFWSYQVSQQCQGPGSPVTGTAVRVWRVNVRAMLQLALRQYSCEGIVTESSLTIQLKEQCYN